MLDDFFTRALLAGIGVALVAGPLGCFIVWRRMAYFGDTLSHGALLGVCLGILAGANVVISVFVLSALIALALMQLMASTRVGMDSLLGILSHATLALGLVAMSFMTWVRIDVTGLLFGDILAVSRTDLAFIFLSGLAVLAILAYIWGPLFASTVNPDLARAEGVQVERTNLIFMLLLASAVAISMKIVGVLLITALLIIPAAAARQISTTPEGMAIMASIAGIVSVCGGLFGSLAFNTPSGPSIVVMAFLLFLLSLLPFIKKRVSNDGL